MITIEQGYVGVVTQFGKFHHLLPPGRHRFNIMAEQVIPVSLKVRCLDVHPQELMTADKLTIKIDAVCFYRVFDAQKATFAVENYEFALGNLAQVFGQRQKLNTRLRQLIDEASDPWGVKVANVEIKGIEIDRQMQRAMAAKAEANQMAEAKIIQSRAQNDAAKIIQSRAGQMEEQPAALRLQWMETLRTISTQGKNPCVIIPEHMDTATALAARTMATGGAVAGGPPRR